VYALAMLRVGVLAITVAAILGVDLHHVYAGGA
jgi:hypothetical protein